MKYDSYAQFEKIASNLFHEGMLKEALDLIEKAPNLLAKKDYEEHWFEFECDKAFLHHFLENNDGFYQVVSDLIDKGTPISKFMYNRFPEGEARFEALKTKNDALLEAAQEQAELQYFVHMPEGYSEDKQYPVFLALHGDGPDGNVPTFSRYWTVEPFTSQGFIFVYVQSSQVVCYEGYGWLGNPEKSREDIRTCYDKVRDEYSVDEDSVFIGGFSGGAICTLDITMANVIPAKGFIGLCPERKPAGFTRENVEAAARRGVKGVFMEGEKVLPMEAEDEMMNTCKEVGLPFEYYINKGMGHQAPPDFSEKLAKALKFVTT